MKNVDYGIQLGAPDSVMECNTVENFAGDGLRGLGDNSVFQYNTVKNCDEVYSDHRDGFPSWALGPGAWGGASVSTAPPRTVRQHPADSLRWAGGT